MLFILLLFTSLISSSFIFFFFFFNHTATTEIYTLSLHDALPICRCRRTAHPPASGPSRSACRPRRAAGLRPARRFRSEEHTFELQSLRHLVCRLLLEKKKKKNKIIYYCE